MGTDYETLFELAPVALWLEDYSALHALYAAWRAAGIIDLRAHLLAERDRIVECSRCIRVVKVNRKTLALLGADSLEHLVANLDRVFRDSMLAPHIDELLALWNGELEFSTQSVNHTLRGERLDILVKGNVLPAHRDDWARVLVATEDITARVRAEAHLEYLGKHDALTRLRNRAHFEEELDRTERGGPWPVTIVVIDLNRLKLTNDESGHAAGDALLRRAGEVLGRAVAPPACAARVGGDEFVLLMPGADKVAGELALERLRSLVELNNQSHPGAPLSLAMGCATAQKGERLEAVVTRADERMFEDKRGFYEGSGTGRPGCSRSCSPNSANACATCAAGRTARSTC